MSEYIKGLFLVEEIDFEKTEIKISGQFKEINDNKEIYISIYTKDKKNIQIDNKLLVSLSKNNKKYELISWKKEERINFIFEKVLKVEKNQIIIETKDGKSIKSFKNGLVKGKEYIGFGFYNNNIFEMNDYFSIISGIIEVEKILKNNSKYNSYFFNGKFIEYNSYDKIPSVDFKFSGFFVSLYKDDKYEIRGFWKKYKNNYIFNIISHKKTIGSELVELYHFLKITVPGIDKIAEKIVNTFKIDTINIIKKHPDRLLEIKGISKNKKDMIHKKIMESELQDNIISFLIQNDFHITQAIKVFKKFGILTFEEIEKNPYIFNSSLNIDFKLCDNLAKSYNFEYFNEIRVSGFILYFIKNEIQNKGDIFVLKNDIYENLNNFIKINGVYPKQDINKHHVDEGFKYLLKDKTIIEEIVDINNEQECLIYLKKYNFMENMIVKRLYSMISEYKTPLCTRNDINDFILEYEEKNFSLAENQKEAIYNSLLNGFSIITGGPGTGKTQTINTIIQCIKSINPEVSIDLCAPTGKASNRISEVTGIEAYTIHRKLKLNPFDFNQELEYINSDLLIIDESSMIDIDLFYQLLNQIEDNTRIILVGDYNQLPSVGPGLILRDLINSGVIPTIVLNEVFRQKEQSRIILNAHKIIKNEYDLDLVEFEDLKDLDDKEKDFIFIKTKDCFETISRLNEVIEKLDSNFNDIQILSPLNITNLGTFHLNSLIQDLFNKEKSFKLNPTTVFKVKDKVIQTKNNYTLNIFNGSVGIIEKIENKDGYFLFEIDFDGNTVIYDESEMIDEIYSTIEEQLNLAYVISVHKSQGSEFPVVIIPIDKIFSKYMDKNLFYTGITRAKTKIVLIGDIDEINNIIRKENSISRKSRIKEKLMFKFSKN